MSEAVQLKPQIPGTAKGTSTQCNAEKLLFHLRAVEADASQGEPANCSEILPFQPFGISDVCSDVQPGP